VTVEINSASVIVVDEEIVDTSLGLTLEGIDGDCGSDFIIAGDKKLILPLFFISVGSWFRTRREITD